MQRTLFLFFVVPFVFFVGCKKKDEAHYSRWYVNKDTFSSNNVTVFRNRVELNMDCYARPDYFGFDFPYSDFMIGTTYKVYGEQRTAYEQVGVGFIHDTTVYHPTISCRTYIQVNSVDGKAAWIMAPTWCINVNNPTDSVLAGGEFSEP